MPKMKTHRGAAKRFKITATGKVKRSKAYTSHILTKKTAGRKRHLAKSGLVSKSDESRIRRMLPYGS
jgi:large subunit ribosomal protein L35